MILPAARPLTAGPNSANWSTTVPRHLVHRAAVAEVFLTGSSQTGPETFTVATQWPRGHSLWGASANRPYDTLIAVETLRQCGLLIAHRHLRAPLDRVFLLENLALDIRPERLLAADGPAELLLRVRCTDLEFRREILTRISVIVEFIRDGEPVGAGTASGRLLDPRVYQRLRSGTEFDLGADLAPVRPLRPWTVGRRTAEDVLLGEALGDRRWPVRHLLDHPVLFDHPVDHLPGMYLLEAMRQAALAAHGVPTDVLGVRVEFHRFAALDIDTVVDVRPTAPQRYGVTIHQQGAEISTGELRLARR